jgi:hypothetical protein
MHNKSINQSITYKCESWTKKKGKWIQAGRVSGRRKWGGQIYNITIPFYILNLLNKKLILLLIDTQKLRLRSIFTNQQ